MSSCCVKAVVGGSASDCLCPRHLGCASGTRHLSPLDEGSVAEEAIVSCFELVTAKPEEIVDRSVGRLEALGMPHRFKLPHLPFPLAGRLV